MSFILKTKQWCIYLQGLWVDFIKVCSWQNITILWCPYPILEQSFTTITHCCLVTLYHYGCCTVQCNHRMCNEKLLLRKNKPRVWATQCFCPRVLRKQLGVLKVGQQWGAVHTAGVLPPLSFPFFLFIMVIDNGTIIPYHTNSKDRKEYNCRPL